MDTCACVNTRTSTAQRLLLAGWHRSVCRPRPLRLRPVDHGHRPARHRHCFRYRQPCGFNNSNDYPKRRSPYRPLHSSPRLGWLPAGRRISGLEAVLPSSHRAQRQQLAVTDTPSWPTFFSSTAPPLIRLSQRLSPALDTTPVDRRR